MDISGVEKLSERHSLSRFESGQPRLDSWFSRFARAAQAAETCQTYVIHRAGTVVGFYSLAAASIEPDAAPVRVAKGTARQPISVILIARLAVDRREQGRGLGKALLKDALRRISGAADIIGARAALVHAKDDAGRAFYEGFGFVPAPGDERTLLLLMKDLRAQL